MTTVIRVKQNFVIYNIIFQSFMPIYAISKQTTKNKALVFGGSSQFSKKHFMLGRTSGFKPSDVYSKSQMLL